jgi:Protein tyrosine and serine/threonine kinase
VTYYTPACDVFMFSFIMWELANGGDPVWGPDTATSEVCANTIAGSRPPTENIDWAGEFLRIMEACWSQNPTARPDARKLSIRCEAALETMLESSDSQTTLA